MTADQFNQKYIRFLEDGHYGCDIYNQEAIDYLDKKFQEFVKRPDFKYQQIKIKFESIRFYADGVTYQEAHDIERKIEKIYGFEQ